MIDFWLSNLKPTTSHRGCKNFNGIASMKGFIIDTFEECEVKISVIVFLHAENSSGLNRKCLMKNTSVKNWHLYGIFQCIFSYVRL